MNPPARTPEERESQLVNLSMDLAERQLREGTASSQTINHFLKLATVREQLENEKLRSDLEVARAKIKQIESQEDIKELYENAMNALKEYSGRSYGSDEEDYLDEY